MRLALVHKRFDRLGGAEWDCYETTQRLAARGHDVHLVVGQCRAPPPEGVTVHKVPVVRIGQIAKLLSFAAAAPRVWRSLGADVVIGFGRTIGQDIMRASGGCHRRYLADLATDRGAREAWRQRVSLYECAMLAIERRQYRQGASRKVLTVSSLARNELLATYPGLSPAAVEVLPYGVDAARFRSVDRAQARTDLRRELELPADVPLVITVGTGFRRKGIDLLLELWRWDAPRGAALVVVGNDQRLAAWRRAARELPGPVVFTGPRRDIERLYAAADAFVLASIQDAFGMVVLEALASGLPVVTSRMVGASEVLKGPLAELVVEDPRDGPSLHAALERALDPTVRERLAEAAHRAASARSIDAAVDDLERCCELLAGVTRSANG